MMYSPPPTFSKPMPPPNIDRRKLYKNFLCGICDKIIKKAAILKMCSCRFCHACILAAYKLGEKTCPHPHCTLKPKPQLRSPADVLLNPPFDQLVTMCGFQPHQSKEDFLDSASLAKLASQNVQKVMVNRKRPYEAPPDLISPRKATFKPFDNQQLQQPKNSFDLENSLLKAFMTRSYSVQPIQSSFAKNRWILAKQRLRENENGDPSVMKKRVLGAISDSDEESDMESNISGCSWKRQTEANENDQEESDISDSTESEMEVESEEPKAEGQENGPSTSQEATQEVPKEATEDERLEEAAREIYLAEQQRIRAMAELDDPKHPLILWPDMRLELKEISRRQLHAHYLFVPNSCTMETLGKFVLQRLFQEEYIDFEQEELTVTFVPVVEEIEATNIIILKREPKQGENNQEKSEDHAVTLKIDNPHQASVLIFDPSMMVTKKSTMAEVRAVVWKDHSKPMKLIYQIKLKSSEKSPFTSAESPLHTPITTEAPAATTPTSSTNTSTPSDPAPSTPKEIQPFTLPMKHNSNNLTQVPVPMLKNEAPKPIQLIEPKPFTLTTLPAPFVPPQIPPPILPSGMRSYPFPPLTSPLPTAPLILPNRPNIPFLAASNMANSSIEQLNSHQHSITPQAIPQNSPSDPRVEIGGNDGDCDGMPTLDPEI
ncbi:unnamed protein product, partial [Mesorhabditis belari]|uniref:RING-type domain-containing protein n=1 Tax=Mesorhabditis belari TaxID=2138241 RepID=A0AAF3EK46_9BILA